MAERVFHPSIAAVRDLDFDFSLVREVSAVCATCGRPGSVRQGEVFTPPCGHPETCGFVLDLPGVDADGSGDLPQWRDAVLRGAVERVPDVRTVPRNLLPPPRPPRNAEEWRARQNAVAAMAPALGHSYSGLPIGWLGVIDLAAHALDARGVGASIQHRQSKEKFGTARIYISPTGSRMDDPAFQIADAVVDWAEAMTEFVCARDGTMDGRLGRVSGWSITLGERAWVDVEVANCTLGAWRQDVLGLYPGWDSDDD